VIALGSVCASCSLNGPYSGIFGEWLGVYPGFRNLGFIGFMKLLGFVDLPGMVAPTEISAATDYGKMEDPSQGWLYASNSATGASALSSQVTPHLSQTAFDTFAAGGKNSKYYSKAGIAAVISKSERKIIFLDLKPLFRKVQGTYFGGTLAQLQNTIASRGPGDTQWPPVFAADNYAPTYITTVSLSEKPTAVRVSTLPSVGRTWVATQDGTIHAYASGGWQAGTDSNPASIVGVGQVIVGRNPTSMVHPTIPVDLNNAQPMSTAKDRLWVVSRGDRRIDYVNMSSMTIEKTLRDSRLEDPIAAYDTRYNPVMVNVVTVVDYGGKQVMNYRYSNVYVGGLNSDQTWGIGSTGTDLFEFGGSYSVPGKPFQFTQSNIP
jgi:hypothetical protein